MPKILKIIVGIGLLTLGVVVQCGWLLQIPLMVQFHIGLVPLVFNTGFCFALTGVALVLPEKFPSYFQTVIGLVLVLLCTLTFIEILFDLQFGIDWPQLHTWINDSNIRPGRMAPNTALGFITIGCTLILMSKVSTTWQARLVQILTFIVLAIGLTGLVGYSLAPDLLYGWARSARMAIPTACGMILSGIALWLSWSHADWYRSRSHFFEDEKITFMGTAIIVIISITAGLVGFVAQQSVLEKSLQQRLQSTYSYRFALFHTSIDKIVEGANALAKQTEVIHYANYFNKMRGSNSEEFESFFQMHQFNAVALQDVSGNELARVGHFLQNENFKADLSTSTTSTLVWDDALFLRTKSPIYDGPKLIGFLTIEHSLSALSQQLFNTQELGLTGEAVICRDEVTSLLCLSATHKPEIYRVKPYSKYGSPLPMKLALSGQSGIDEAIDYRDHNVVAVYNLLVPGLGMVNKVDTTELYSDIRKQFKFVMELLLLLTLIAVILIRSQLKPLARRLIASETKAAEKKEHISTLLRTVGEGILTIDEKGIIESFNPSAEEIFGYSAEQVIGKNIKILMPSHMHEGHDAGMYRYLTGGQAHVIGKKNVELPGLRSDASVFQLELTVNEMHVQDRRLFVGIVRDITERKKSEQELFAEKERLRVTLRSIGDAVITADINGLITYLNPVAEIMTGWSNQVAQGRPTPEIFNIIQEKTLMPAPDPVQAVLQGRAGGGITENTILVQRYSGAHFPIEDTTSAIRGRDGEVIGVVIVFHDASEIRKMTAEMTYQATHDSLTGLINRREFERRIEFSLQSGKMERKEHSLLYLDLDKFKIVNDTSGHVAGDELLRQLSGLLLSKLRQTDTLARLGGDEFGVLLESCSTSTALKIAETLRITVNDFQFVWQDNRYSIGVTIGLVTYTGDSFRLSDILQMADSACYLAKEKGRNRVQIYLPENQEFSDRRGQMGWLERIHSALTENGFVLYSQKILSLADQSDNLHEELFIRMLDKDGSLVPPMAFIPPAERHGLMPQIDRWVVSKAFEYLVALPKEKQVKQIVSINLSGSTLCDDQFLSFIHSEFDRHKLPASCICFEISETTAVANLTQATKLIKSLQAIGCLFALDDFGGGISSFGYLKQLPVNFLKIDGSFVGKICTDDLSKTIVESITRMGHVMGIKIIAESVEDKETLDLLQKLGVDFAQGYTIENPKVFSG